MDGASATPLRIAVGGPPETAERWARAFRGVEGAGVARLEGVSQASLAETFAEQACAALVIAGVERELPALIRAAMLAGCDVFVADTPALTSEKFASLAELARRRGRIVAFHDEQIDDERTAFVRRMTRGSQPMWRPRYLRSQRTGEGGAIDDAAIEQIRLASDLLGRSVERVSAVAPDTDEGPLEAALITILLEGGIVAQIDVSAMEPDQRRETVLVCEGRTVTLDALDPRAPLRIAASARHRGPQAGAGWSEVISEFPPLDQADAVSAAAERFIKAVCARDREATNAGSLAAAAAIWEAARRSIAEEGEPQDLTAAMPTVERPALRLIAGGGGGSRRSASPAPQLTVVRNEPVPIAPKPA